MIIQKTEPGVRGLISADRAHRVLSFFQQSHLFPGRKVRTSLGVTRTTSGLGQKATAPPPPTQRLLLVRAPDPFVWSSLAFGLIAWEIYSGYQYWKKHPPLRDSIWVEQRLNVEHGKGFHPQIKAQDSPLSGRSFCTRGSVWSIGLVGMVNFCAEFRIRHLIQEVTLGNKRNREGLKFWLEKQYNWGNT